jgi:hypothetical protein
LGSRQARRAEPGAQATGLQLVNGRLRLAVRSANPCAREASGASRGAGREELGEWSGNRGGGKPKPPKGGCHWPAARSGGEGEAVGTQNPQTLVRAQPRSSAAL